MLQCIFAIPIADAQFGRGKREFPAFGVNYPSTNVIKVLVVRVNCADAEIPCTERELDAAVFGTEGSINSIFTCSSYGKWRLKGAVLSVKYSGSKSTVRCAAAGRSEWFEANIDPLINRQGRSIADYDRVLYVLPFGIARWSGNFDIGGLRIYTTDGTRPKVAAHELAHTFGMQHSATTAPLKEHEYGDHADVLGGGVQVPVAQMNAARALKFGFIPAAAIEEVTSSGLLSIEALEIAPEKARKKQVLRLYRTGSGRDAEYYYISLRRPIGIDAKLAGYTHEETLCKSYVDRLNIHRFKPEAFGYRDKMTYLVGLLKEGESFADDQYGIRFTFSAFSNGVASVVVSTKTTPKNTTSERVR